ncbi:MAG: DUF559 domain-containing protein [Myxococcota bacterium]
MKGAELQGLRDAAESWGLVTRAEARRYLTARQLRRRRRSGVWVEVFPSVFRVVGAPVSWRQTLQALLRSVGPRAVLSHRTAAALHGLPGFEEGPLELTATKNVRRRKDVRVYRVKAMLPSELTEVDDFAVTSVARTLLDLAAETDRPTMRAAIDHALRNKLTTVEELERVVARAKGKPGVGDMREFLDEFRGAGGPTESELEQKALEVIEQAGLPRPRVQWRVVVGRQRRRLDLAYAERRLVIEVDGYAYHSGIDTFEADRQRNNSLIARGFRVLHWTWRGIHERADELLEELRAALAR